MASNDIKLFDFKRFSNVTLSTEMFSEMFAKKLFKYLDLRKEIYAFPFH